MLLFDISCPSCKTNRQIKVHEKGYNRWKSGELIQRVLPELSPDDREALMTGLCGTCWNTITIEPDETYLIDSATKAERATQRGLAVVYARENVLQLDLDTEDAKRQYAKLRPLVETFWIIENETSWPSKSGNLHVELTLSRPLPAPMRIALQAILGSDPKRETFCLAKYAKDDPNPIMLFKPAPKSEVCKAEVSILDDDYTPF